MDILEIQRLLPHRYPFLMVDRVVEIVPDTVIRAYKNVSANEQFFQGHFPGHPVMPGVLIVEALAQAAALLSFKSVGLSDQSQVVYLAGLDAVRFRKPVVPGDRLDLEVTITKRRGGIWKMRGEAKVGGVLVAEAELMATLAPRDAKAAPLMPVHATAIVDRHAELDSSVEVGPYTIIGPRVKIGPRTTVGPHVVIEGDTTLGTENRIFQFAAIGAIPQDLKYAGEPTKLVIGDRNQVREFATLHIGSAGGGGVTRVGHKNLFMANSHVAHDCQVGSGVVLANSVALAGHVIVGDDVVLGGLAAVHQFSRIGRHAFIAAGSLVTMDIPPYCMAQGDRAQLVGINSIGLTRRGFSEDVVGKIKAAYKVLFRSGLGLREALARVKAESGAQPEIAELVGFIEGSERGIAR